MKIFKNYFIYPSLFILIFVGCAKTEKIEMTENTVGHSGIIYFPTISTNGDRLTIIQQGEAFTDPGATAALGGVETTYTTDGTVGTTPGVYSLTYSAKNEEGYTAEDYRTVVIIGSDVQDSRDFSGTYARYVGGAPNGQSSTWTKLAKGVYRVVNPGGATGVTAIAVNYTGNLITIPPQTTEAGLFYSSITSTSGFYFPDAIPPYYEWQIINPGYGTALRKFVKQ